MPVHHGAEPARRRQLAHRQILASASSPTAISRPRRRRSRVIMRESRTARPMAARTTSRCATRTRSPRPREGTTQDHDAAARRDRVDVAARRRHRDHEHHARVGDGADARDRHPHGHRRARLGRAHAVPRREHRHGRARRRWSASPSVSAVRSCWRTSPAGALLPVGRSCSRSASRRRSVCSSATTRRGRRRRSIRSRHLRYE